MDQFLPGHPHISSPNQYHQFHFSFEMTLPGMKKPLKPIPVFKQMPGEKKKQFFRRMDLTVQVTLKLNKVFSIC